jgi:hypothetical protein
LNMLIFFFMVFDAGLCYSVRKPLEKKVNGEALGRPGAFL